ncbi:hypothetical protein B0H14DRAFT_2779253 [Mycena olivaceomarginata]|nr:hypothetical protein B0H14DRAFT_2779253 [Mycena olivaceomarginata]
MTSGDTNFSLCFQRPSAPEVSRDKAVIAAVPIPRHLPPNSILIKVDRFGFSANNITYQALGEQAHFRYYDFHPAPGNRRCFAQNSWTCSRVGFGTIRIYGYLAPSRYLLVPVSPSDVNRHAFYVPATHISQLVHRRPYNQIIRCAGDPEYTPTTLGEDLTMLYRPLFWTAYWFEDWIFSLGYRGATAFVISSASAKTAFCAAYLIGKRRSRGETNVKIVGVTSKGNTAFTKGLSLYDEVVEYDSFKSALGQGKWVYVDVAGKRRLQQAARKAASLDWTTPTFTGSSKVPALEQFFMVEWLDVRKHQLSLHEIFRRQKQAWTELMVDCIPWVRLEHVSGADEVKKAYDKIATRGFSPDVGFIWSLWDEEADKNVPAKM